MKMIVISDNQFYINAFCNSNNCIAISPEHLSLINEQNKPGFYARTVIIISIADKNTMLNVLAAVMIKNALAVFIQPVQWPAIKRVFYTCNVYVLPSRMRMEQLMSIIKNCLLCSSGVFSINPDKVKNSEWNTMLYLLSGISNRHLSQMLNASEKTISGRVNSLAIKMGLSGLNKATQLNAMHLFYQIYTSRKSAGERNYFKKQQAYISESLKNWSVAV